ncbi:MAG: Potassium voltage-gated channel subfamily KQT; possible potassium channel, VIC family [uncultured Quadrisphaera sp.]|uniref:Potassium voltage-gated channel subfamily KQT possible potassium channel, VIC family n=1 Tax=uncultured Quadrisphaera sp. TaxID=904978 RepID=A0A6J4NID3_9ACTN|nr:MAG: Potassium voltage-gated channel subfamily KQT; possible potassium channel, VIC family [uncultured Quadrisphaera sp.]
MTEPRRDAWERRAEWPLTLAAIAFLGAYAWPILDPSLGRPWSTLCTAVTTAVWALFALDYLVRLVLSRQRRRFVRGNLLDLAIIVLPVLRPLRLLRLFTLLSLLNRYAGMSLRGRVAVYVGGSTLLVLLLGALAVLDAERGAEDTSITSFGDALWWSVTTVTSVGYGDTYPVTTAGRFVGVALMLTGIGLIGVVTASVATWLVQQVSDADEEAEAARRRDLLALSGEIAALREELARRT